MLKKLTTSGGRYHERVVAASSLPPEPRGRARLPSHGIRAKAGRSALIALAALLLSPINSPAINPTIYVGPNGNNANPGTSPDAPVQTADQAFKLAINPSNTISSDPGVILWTNRVFMSNNIAVNAWGTHFEATSNFTTTFFNITGGFNNFNGGLYDFYTLCPTKDYNEGFSRAPGGSTNNWCACSFLGGVDCLYSLQNASVGRFQSQWDRFVNCTFTSGFDLVSETLSRGALTNAVYTEFDNCRFNAINIGQGQQSFGRLNLNGYGTNVFNNCTFYLTNGIFGNYVRVYLDASATFNGGSISTVGGTTILADGVGVVVYINGLQGCTPQNVMATNGATVIFGNQPVWTAQTNAPPASYVRSYVNDLPDQPLVTVTVAGALNVSCLTIEEHLPGPATPTDVSGDGVWLPALRAIRWGPYFNTVATNVSYRLTGPAGSYPVDGGSWMDGQWYFSSGLTTVAVLPPAGGVVVPLPPSEVATPVFSPASGADVPTNVTISDETTNAEIYYTLDGTQPTTNSLFYTGAVSLTNASTVRAAAFLNGWTSSIAARAYYGPPAATANAQVGRSVDMSDPTAPVVTFNVTPGTNAACVAVTETLPSGLAASNVTAGGSYLAGNNVVVWGPFFGTNALVLSYVAAGLPGTYPVQAAWSVDGVGGGEAEATNIIVTSLEMNNLPAPPSQVAAPVFTPASGGSAPVDVAISSSTPGATVYYTTDGSLPTQDSAIYSGPIYLASAGTIRAVAFTNGWTPSEASAAYYGPPAAAANAQVTRSVDTTDPTAPVVTFNVTPGTNAACVAVTETLPPGLAASNVTAGGSYLAGNNAVVWGPFFGTNALVLSYVAAGLPGTYPVQAMWSVDGVGGNEALGTIISVISPLGGNVPTPPPQEPVPTLTPSAGTSLPVSVSISSSDPQAQICFTTDGTLPTQGSTPYTGSLAINTPTTLRAVAFRAGYLPSVGAAAYYGNYAAALPTNSLSLVRSISGNGNFLPTVTLIATPQGNVSCYAVTETIVPGLTPAGLAADAVWNPVSRTISWGPYLDNLPRNLTYTLSGPAGTFPLSGQGSFDGYTATVTGATTVTFNPTYMAPPTNYETCLSEPISYSVDINPAPGIIVVDSASGTVDWGDGTQSAVTGPVMSIPKLYPAAGNYTITLTASWIGHTVTSEFFGNGTESDSAEVYPSCDPVITNEPSDQVVVAGGTAQFSVGVSSYFPVTYQWIFNQGGSLVSSLTSATLNLPDVTPDDAGYYSVLVTSAYGSTNSMAAKLTVVTASITSITRNGDGSVTLNFLGLPNATARIWATTNLSLSTSWQPIDTNYVTNPDGSWQFTDTNAVNFGAQFYRLSTP